MSEQLFLSTPPWRRARRGVSTRRDGQRGAASLIVVMVLFFIMSLVAAYTSRNLIFEQRTSVNQQRAMQAHEAAEAGLEWAVAQLNGGRITANCLEAGATAADTSFRQRYLNINTNLPPDPDSGKVTALVQPAPPAPGLPQPRRAGCVWNGLSWSCSCPSDADPTPAVPVGTGIFPAFWVSFSNAGVTRPGVVKIVSNGCTSLDVACLSSAANASNVEGRALVTAIVALKSAVATPPAAALTVIGNVNRVLGSGTLSVTNEDVERGGRTIHAFEPLVGMVEVALRTLPGTPASASFIEDNSLRKLLDPLPADLTAAGRAPADFAFSTTFSAWPSMARRQPGAVRLDCPVAGCAAALASAVALNPDRVIWIEGDLTLEAGGDIGSLPDPLNPAAPGPAAIIATGSLIVSPGGAGARVFGMVYTRGGGWAGGGQIQGAAFVESNLAATAAQTVVFNGSVIDTLRLRAGSFVRAPGGWRDFP